MNLNRLYRSIGYLIIIFSLSSCAFYRPSAVKNPILKKKGDIQLAASLGSTLDANIAWSPIDHFYVNGSAGTTFGVEENANDSTNPEAAVEYPNYHYELSIGIYDSIFNDLRIQGTLGIGEGKAAGRQGETEPTMLIYIPILFDRYQGIYGADYHNYFGQVALASEIGDQLNFCISYRMNYLDIGRIDYFSGDGSEANFQLEPRSHFVDQLAFELNKEEKDIGGFIQFQISAARPYSDVITVRNFGIHVGLYLKLNELFERGGRKKKKKASKPTKIDLDQEYRSNW